MGVLGQALSKFFLDPGLRRGDGMERESLLKGTALGPGACRNTYRCAFSSCKVGQFPCLKIPFDIKSPTMAAIQ